MAVKRGLLCFADDGQQGQIAAPATTVFLRQFFETDGADGEDVFFGCKPKRGMEQAFLDFSVGTGGAGVHGVSLFGCSDFRRPFCWRVGWGRLKNGIGFSDGLDKFRMGINGEFFRAGETDQGHSGLFCQSDGQSGGG